MKASILANMEYGWCEQDKQFSLSACTATQESSKARVLQIDWIFEVGHDRRTISNGPHECI